MIDISARDNAGCAGYSSTNYNTSLKNMLRLGTPFDLGTVYAGRGVHAAVAYVGAHVRGWGMRA